MVRAVDLARTPWDRRASGGWIVPESRTTSGLVGAIRSCPCCGLGQTVPPVPPGMRACCARCGTSLHKRSTILRSNSRTAAIALAALVLYPLAVSLPMIRVERFGHHNEASILEGTATLLASGHVVVGLIVLLCSVILPLGKLLALLLLSAGGLRLRHQHRALTSICGELFSHRRRLKGLASKIVADPK